MSLQLSGLFFTVLCKTRTVNVKHFSANERLPTPFHSGPSKSLVSCVRKMHNQTKKRHKNTLRELHTEGVACNFIKLAGQPWIINSRCCDFLMHTARGKRREMTNMQSKCAALSSDRTMALEPRANMSSDHKEKNTLHCSSAGAHERWQIHSFAGNHPNQPLIYAFSCLGFHLGGSPPLKKNSKV